MSIHAIDSKRLAQVLGANYREAWGAYYTRGDRRIEVQAVLLSAADRTAVALLADRLLIGTRGAKDCPHDGDQILLQTPEGDVSLVVESQGGSSECFIALDDLGLVYSVTCRTAEREAT